MNRSTWKAWERFIAKTAPVGACIEWQGANNGRGYGQFWHEGRMVYAHRFSFEATVRPLADGEFIDHLCRNTRCVNPEHLEPVSNAENVRRGYAFKNVCRNGHEKSGNGYCPICLQEMRSRYAPQRAEYQREYRKKNPGRHAAYQRKYNAEARQ